jgi:hypothetical protein
MRSLRLLLQSAYLLCLMLSVASYGRAQQPKPLFQIRKPEILSDTKGVDVCPYVWNLARKVGNNWNNLIPPEAMPPFFESGTTKIEFVVLKSGAVKGMKLVEQSRISMDRAAWGGITSSVPFDRIPDEFKGEYLVLRFTFVYNPKRPITESRCADPVDESKQSPSTPH